MKVSSQVFFLNSHYQRSRRGLESAMTRLASGDQASVVGSAPAAHISISERLRHQIRINDASVSNIQRAMSFLDAADAYAEKTGDILSRMMELATSSVDGLKTAADRKTLQQEFSILKQELGTLSRETRYVEEQVIGRDVMASFDSNTDRFRFWQQTGDGVQQIERDFSATALDSKQNLINFDSSQDFSMSRDGRTLYYLSNVTADGAGTTRLHAYDLDTQEVRTGSDVFATWDTLHVDEGGDLFVNGAGTIYSVDAHSLAGTASAITDVTASTQFSVYKGQVVYFRNTDNRIVEADPASGTPTTLTSPLVFGAAGHTFSGSGKFIAEESVPGSIRVIDTRTGNEATLAIGGANDVVNMNFSEDGNRVYYINRNTNSIDYVSVEIDEDDNVLLSYGGKAVQGTNVNSFNGLDLGGSNPATTKSFVFAQGTTSVLTYKAVDLDLYALGLDRTHINTATNADTAISDIQEAQNRVSAARAQIRATASRFRYALEGQRKMTGVLRESESQIRDVDVAKESIRFSEFQVRSQAAQAILSQYHALSRNVLSLLQQ